MCNPPKIGFKNLVEKTRRFYSFVFISRAQGSKIRFLRVYGMYSDKWLLVVWLVICCRECVSKVVYGVTSSSAAYHDKGVIITQFCYHGTTCLCLLYNAHFK